MFSRATHLSAAFSRLSFQKLYLRKMTTAKLNTGASIPALGFGTWQGTPAIPISVPTSFSK
jgi:hypothetical protein